MQRGDSVIRSASLNRVSATTSYDKPAVHLPSTQCYSAGMNQSINDNHTMQ